MKRKREIEKKTEIKSAIEELSLIIKLIHRATSRNNNNNKLQSRPTVGAGATTTRVVGTATAGGDIDAATTAAGETTNTEDFVVSNIPTRPFLALCTLIIQVLDKIGPTMAVLRQDINKNIQRLEMLCDSDPTKYSNLVEILNKEAVERCAKKSDSCSKALLWLTRSLDFTAALLQNLLVAEPGETMDQIVGNSYEKTLKPWHGWISAAAYKVALKLVPDTETFVSLLMNEGDGNIDSFKDEIQAFVSLLVPLLKDLHSILSLYRLEKLKST